MDITFGICGILGGILCACGDLLLDLKGRDNKKLGSVGIMDSKWESMDENRFRYSIYFAAAGVPLCCFGMSSMANQLSFKNEKFGLIFWMFSVAGCIGGFFIHAFLCLMPVIYKKLIKVNQFEVIDDLITTLYRFIKKPFFIFYIMLTCVTSVMLIAAIFMDYLVISPVFCLFTPLSLIVVGMLLRKIKYDWFYDLPGIAAASIGLGMIGLMSVCNQFSIIF